MRDDWVSPWWQAMLLPDQWDVCGVSVPSLSVWHVFALENIGNRYICGDGTNADKDDAASLLLFARRDMQGGRRLFARPNYRARQTRSIYKRLKRADDERVADACLEYVTVCMRHGNRINQAGASGTPCGTPEPWALVALLRSMGDTFDAAWNTPYATARALLDAHAESTGRAVMTPVYGEEMIDNWDEYKDQTDTKELRIA